MKQLALLAGATVVLALAGCDRSLQEFGPVPADDPALAAFAGVPETLDLEALPPGTIVNTVYGDAGSGPITVEGVSPRIPGTNVALIFDSSNPTGGDTDLGSPNNQCGGPGIGGNVGPGTQYENCTALEHILIIAADLDDDNGDGLVDDPDDIDAPSIPDATITLGFDALGTVTAHSIRIIDFDGNGPNPRVQLFAEGGGLLSVIPLPNDMPDNGAATIDLGDVPGVATMVVYLNGSGGLDTVIFTPEVGGGPCRVTGGGVDTFGDWDGTFAKGNSGRGSEANRYQFGGQAGAPTANQPQPYGEWTHHQQRGPDGRFVFHAGTASAPPGTEIDFIQCSDPGWCHPARPAPAKQIDFEGVGTFKNIQNPSPLLSGVVPGETFHWFEVHIEDLGEPGRSGRQDPPGGECSPVGHEGVVAPCSCPDFYRITIYEGVLDPAVPNKTDIIYEVYGYLTGGNLQIHPPID